MKIESISYKEVQGGLTVWEINNFVFSDINLVVAKNATGKSRTLNIISFLANLVINSNSIIKNNSSYEYRVNFNSNESYYELKVVNGVINHEKLVLEGHLKISRDEEGKTCVFFDEVKDYVDGILDKSILAISQRDLLQKKYLIDLHDWALNTILIKFGSDHAKNTYVTKYSETFETSWDIIRHDSIPGYLIKAEADNKLEELKIKIIFDLNRIGYDIEDISYCDSSIVINNTTLLQKISVKEKGLLKQTHQEEMSNGMIRAISLIVKFNYIEMYNAPCCILIDDIGEGLDFERSSELIKILIEKINTQTSEQQLLMSTNDRFVMNAVDLKYWSILSRNEHTCSMMNIKTHPDTFEEFEFTGLNNFDFFSTEFYKEEI